MTASNFIETLEDFLFQELAQVEESIRVSEKYNLPTNLMLGIGERHQINKVLDQIAEWRIANGSPTTNPTNSGSYSEYLDPPILW